MRGVFLDLESVDAGDLELAQLERALADWTFHAETPAQQVADRIDGFEVVVSNKVVLSAEAITNAQALRCICVAATGTNNVDLAAARHRGITVSNVVGYATPAVVQHVFSLLLALSTRLLDYDRWVQDGNWQRHGQFCSLDFPIRELRGKVMGIVGYGELGRSVAAVAQAFGMEVRVAQRPGAQSPSPGRVPLHTLLAQVDVLSLHCPLTPDTRNLIGAAELALMKPDAVLINTARGGIVDEAALAEALRRGRLGGAGVDVLAQEPPRDGSALLATPPIPNLIVTPHTAWASREARQRMIDEVARNVRAFVEGRPRNVVGG